jgi:hypothetical protein
MRTVLSMSFVAFGLVACSDRRSPPSQAEAVPPKFTPEEVAQSLTLLSREAEEGKVRRTG